MRPGRERPLEELLRELFDDAELGRFLALNYPVAHDAMPSPATPTTRTHHAVRALARHGHLTAELFDLLRAERPHQHARIAAVEHACAPRSPAPSARSARTLAVVALPLLAVAAWCGRRWLAPPSDAAPAPSVPPPAAPAPPADEAEAPRLACPPDAVWVAPADAAPVCIDRHEVSRKEFGLHCKGAREYRHDVPRPLEHVFCAANLPASDAERRPATGMSPREATAHCAARGKRLVTDRDWTAAVAAELGSRDPENLLEFLNVCGAECRAGKKVANKYTHTDLYPEAAPVGLLGIPQDDRPPIHDLFGNVHEFIATEHGFRACGGGWSSSVRGSLDPARCLDPRNPTIPADEFSWYGDRGFRCASDPAKSG